MANGQLGTLGNGVQLATGAPPSQDTTKDRQYYGPFVSAAGGTTPPNWDRGIVWGVDSAYAATSANTTAPDKMQTAPHRFNRAGTIDKILLQVSTTVGNPAKVVLGLYGNILDGEIWPGALLAQSSETTLNTAGSAAYLAWSPGYVVTAGTILWLAVSVGQNNLSYTSGAVDCASMPGLMGTIGIFSGNTMVGGFGSPCSAVRVDSTYSATLPSVFPVTSPQMFYNGAGAGFGTYPIMVARFVKS